MKRLVSIIVMAFMALAVMVTLDACDPVEGEQCKHRGDVFARHGTVLKCEKNKSGQLEWTK